ncbi:MAG: S8 family peptidase [Deltaproteobacteria bacterium]|nr:S8 family peptidase [Myxococcales bacterium]MDP3220214.1 S8 family peptidase [Deltaproteobacteria bacterium]
MDPQAHGARLLQEFDLAWRVAPRTVTADTVLLEFRGQQGQPLVTQSLEHSGAKVRLLSAHTRGDVTRAAVSVPSAKRGHFESRLRKYAAGSPGDGNPAHAALVGSIEHIAALSLAALWTDAMDMPADADAVHRWELWLHFVDGTCEETLGVFRAAAMAAGLKVSEGHARFLDRVVVLARGTSRQIEQSGAVLERVAEIRLARETAAFFSELLPAEEREWTDDLVSRVTPAGDDAPRVCLLDSGVNRAHPLLAPSLHPTDMHTHAEAWGVNDDPGDPHGTRMAGLALLGDLVEPLSHALRLRLTHRLESSKVRSSMHPMPEEDWAWIMTGGIARAEIAKPEAHRVFSMAVSAVDGRDHGAPSLWSAAVDAACCGIADDKQGRLLVLAAGNTPRPSWRSDYPAVNHRNGLCDPAQSFNALTVGAFTEKTRIDDQGLHGLSALASGGDLCPTSATAHDWRSDRRWPHKPDVVFEGGNFAVDSSGAVHDPPSLRLLSTWHEPTRFLLGPMGDTSAATALTARMAAMLWDRYPELWPETVRALVVHSAEWTAAMLAHIPGGSSAQVERRLKVFGHGSPSLERAMWSARDALTLVVQQTIQPYEGTSSHELHEYALPWPTAALEALGETEVTLRVTLSYFVEPAPSRRGDSARYSYASHQLCFDLQTPTESAPHFRSRLNSKDGGRGGSEGDGWTLQSRLRHRGSLRSDRWTGKAVDLAARKLLAVYPAPGWWRDRKDHDRTQQRTRYALVVSIETPPNAADIYTPVEQMTDVRVMGEPVVTAIG